MQPKEVIAENSVSSVIITNVSENCSLLSVFDIYEPKPIRSTLKWEH